MTLLGQVANLWTINGSVMGTVAYNEPVTLIGGAQSGNDEISTAIRLAPRIVAADGGAAHVIAAGYRPERVIGDLDSLSDDLRVSLADVVEQVSEQECRLGHVGHCRRGGHRAWICGAGTRRNAGLGK